MNLKETLQALADGKKIRRKTWVDDHYIYLKNEMIVDENGYEFSPSFVIVKNWEIYKETKKPIDEINEEYKKYNTNWECDDPVGVITAIVKYLNDKEGGK